MPPKKINTGKCQEEQKSCKGFQDLYFSALPTDKPKRETPRPRAGKLLSSTPHRIGDALPKTSPPSPKFTIQRKELSTKSTKSPPKGLLLHTTSATTILQGLKDTTNSSLTKRDLQNSIFSQDPNTDGSKTQRIIQWLKDCEAATSGATLPAPPIIGTSTSSDAGNWRRCDDIGAKSAVRSSRIPLKGPVLEKRKRSNAELVPANVPKESAVKKAKNRNSAKGLQKIGGDVVSWDKEVTKGSVYFERMRLLRDKRKDLWLRRAAEFDADKCRRRKSAVDVGVKNGLKRKVFNTLLENLISTRVAEAKMHFYRNSKLKRRYFQLWRSFALKQCDSSRSTFKKLQVAEDNYSRNLLWNSFYKWKQLGMRRNDKLTQFILMTTNRIREINNRSSPSSEKTVANKDRSSPSSSTKTMQPTAERYKKRVNFMYSHIVVN